MSLLDVWLQLLQLVKIPSDILVNPFPRAAVLWSSDIWMRGKLFGYEKSMAEVEEVFVLFIAITFVGFCLRHNEHVLKAMSC